MLINKGNPDIMTDKIINSLTAIEESVPALRESITALEFLKYGQEFRKAAGEVIARANKMDLAAGSIKLYVLDLTREARKREAGDTQLSIPFA